METKNMGIIRRIDDLGRFVIPREIRATMGLREGEPMEICVAHDTEDKPCIVIKPYDETNNRRVSLQQMAVGVAHAIQKRGMRAAVYGRKGRIVPVGDMPANVPDSVRDLRYFPGNISKDGKWWAVLLYNAGECVGYIIGDEPEKFASHKEAIESIASVLQYCFTD